jgi:hypothetical protein
MSFSQVLRALSLADVFCKCKAQSCLPHLPCPLPHGLHQAHCHHHQQHQLVIHLQLLLAPHTPSFGRRYSSACLLRFAAALAWQQLPPSRIALRRNRTGQQRLYHHHDRSSHPPQPATQAPTSLHAVTSVRALVLSIRGVSRGK